MFDYRYLVLTNLKRLFYVSLSKLLCCPLVYWFRDCTIGGFYKITNYIIVHVPKLSGKGFQATIDSLLHPSRNALRT